MKVAALFNPDDLAREFNFNPRQLTEAFEVLLYHGMKPKDAKNKVRELCLDAHAQGGGVHTFNNLLKGQIAVLHSSSNTPST